jgi:NADH/NAD ratio-sensing transcriptional regulator Rex
MATTIQTTIGVQNLGAGNAIRTGTRQQRNPFSVANASDIASDAVQVVGTAAAKVTIGDASVAAMLVIENESPTATVSVGYDDTGFVALMTIPPGHPPAILPVADPDDIWVQSTAAATPVRVTAIKFVAPS